MSAKSATTTMEKIDLDVRTVDSISMSVALKLTSPEVSLTIFHLSLIVVFSQHHIDPLL